MTRGPRITLTLDHSLRASLLARTQAEASSISIVVRAAIGAYLERSAENPSEASNNNVLENTAIQPLPPSEPQQEAVLQSTIEPTL